MEQPRKLGRKLNIILVNIRSLRANFDELLLFINRNKIKFDILGITESWIRKEESFSYQIPGYKLFVQERTSKLSGGVALYLRSGLKCTVTEIISEQCNALQFKIKGHGACSVSGALIYRFCKSSVTQFLDTLENLGHSLTGQSVIMGDMNLNILPPHNNSAYLNVMASMGFKPILTDATRIQGPSKTCIDHFFYRDPPAMLDRLKIKHKLYSVPFTDHKLAFFEVDTDTHLNTFSNLREIKLTNWDVVSCRLGMLKWDRLYGLGDVNEAFTYFFDSIKQIIDEETKVKIINNQNRKRTNWASKELVNLTASKAKIYKLSKKHPQNVFIKNQLVQISKDVRKKIREDKKAYFSKRLDLCGDDPRKYWKEIKNVISEPQFSVESVLVEGNLLATAGNEKLIANSFNTFFIDKVAEILSSAPGSLPNTNSPDLTEHRLVNSFRFAPITQNEVLEKLKCIPNKLSKGTDGLTSVFLKNNALSLVQPLTWLFNLSINEGVFPEHLKEAIVVPLFKQGDPTNLSNYRPISLLSSVSKLFEKIIHGRLISFWLKYKVFSEKQFGFLPLRSTEMAIFTQIKEIVQGIEKGDFVASIYFDIMKAFDAVQHDLLLRKLEALGIRGKFLEWFGTYLKNRKQRVKINNVLGEIKITTSGVPQGSCLGPLLFIVYVNEVLKLSLNGSVFSYADDTAVLYKEKTSTRLIRKMNEDMQVLQKWFSSHSLLPNLNKTKVMPFGFQRIMDLTNKVKWHQGSTDCPHRCNCSALEQVVTWKYLGLHLDAHLTWANHLKQLNVKIRKLCYLLYYASKHFSREHLKRIYTALLEPNFRYGVTLWSSAGATLVEPIEILQRKAIRTIAGIRIGDNSAQWFSKLNVLTVNNLIKLELATFAHRHMDDPSFFRKQENERSSNSNTRRGINLVPPLWQKAKSRKQAPFAAAVEFNKLPAKIKITKSYKWFRKKAREVIATKLPN